MVEQLNNIGAHSLASMGSRSEKPLGATKTADGADFKSLLARSINEVNQLQTDAEKATTDLVTGKTDNVAEVFTAVQKADIAFQALTKIRNTLMDAYDEVKQMRV